MLTSCNIIKKRKESVKALRSLNKKHIKLKSKVKSGKLGQKKIKQVNTSVETKQVIPLEIGKVKTTKSVNKNFSEVREKTDAISESTFRSSRKKNVRDTGEVRFAKRKHHVDDHGNSKSQHKNSTKDKDAQVFKHILKKKCSSNNDIPNNEKIALHSNVISKTVKLRSLKRKRIDDNNSEENTNTLNLNDLSKEHVVQCISAIFHLTEEQLKSKNALFDGESHPIFMQVTCIRVPKTPKRCMRILLPHSIVSPGDEIALFVGDLQKGRRKDYEPTVEYYEDFLHKHGCTNIKNIIPMNQVKTEYDQYELKRKLVGSYDYFLVDGKIAGHLSHLLGKEFYKKRKLPTPIRMQSKDLKREIEYALRKTVMQMHSFGDTHIVQIGHTSMKPDEILENIFATCNYLSKNYPGGWANIRSIRIKTATSLALPIYTTLKHKNSVKVPVIKPKRPKAYREVSGELTTASGNVIVTVTPEGNVTLYKEKNSKQVEEFNK